MKGVHDVEETLKVIYKKDEGMVIPKRRWTLKRGYRWRKKTEEIEESVRVNSFQLRMKSQIEFMLF